jgi:hypothetical protein
VGGGGTGVLVGGGGGALVGGGTGVSVGGGGTGVSVGGGGTGVGGAAGGGVSVGGVVGKISTVIGVGSTVGGKSWTRLGVLVGVGVAWRLAKVLHANTGASNTPNRHIQKNNTFFICILNILSVTKDVGHYSMDEGGSSNIKMPPGLAHNFGKRLMRYASRKPHRSA